MQSPATTSAGAWGGPEGQGVADYVIADIETYHGNPEEAAKWMRENWWPAENWTAKTIGDRFLEKIEETRQKMATLDEAEIATIQLRTRHETLLLHKFFVEEPRWFAEGVSVQGFASEAELLLAWREWADARTDDETELAGWNIKGFDIPKLRLRSVHHRVRPPRLLLNHRQPVCDMMERYARDWSKSGVPFVKLLVGLEAFGVPTHKGEMDGSMVGALIEAGRFAEVLAYGLNDINEEHELYLRMRGESGEFK